MHKQRLAAIFLIILAFAVTIVLIISLDTFLNASESAAEISSESSCLLYDAVPPGISPCSGVDQDTAKQKFSLVTGLEPEKASMVSFTEQNNSCVLLSGWFKNIEEGLVFLETMASREADELDSQWEQEWQQQGVKIVGFGGEGRDNFLFVSDDTLYWVTVNVSRNSYSPGKLITKLLAE